jgi:nucleotide-binding universal stress UspA family protein
VHLVLVHDSDAYVIGGMGEAAWVTSWEYAEVQQRLGEQLQENVVVPAFKAATEALGAVPGGITQEAVWGHPAETVCERAKTQSADLIVMGSRGRAAFTELVLGSVSSQVLHHAPCPVTVVR